MQISSLFVVFLSAAVALPACAQTAKRDVPEQVGLASHGLQRIDGIAREHIAAGHAAGVVTLVARAGKIEYLGAAGAAYTNSEHALRVDDVIFAASLTKPIVTAAVLTLVDAGKVSLNDPISKLIPEYNQPTKVRILKPGSPPPPKTIGLAPPDPNAPKPQYDLVPAHRAVTVRDLLTHTSGLQTIGVPNDVVPSRPNASETLEHFVARIAGAPLDWQPGTKWGYSNIAGFDVLGRIIEVASGQRLDQYLQAHIFEPLAMNSTGFLGQRDDLTARAAPMDPIYADHPYVIGKPYISGSAGLWTTAEDYGRFAQMLLDGGKTRRGKQLLSRSSVIMMTSNQTADLFPGQGGIPGAETGIGFGLGVLVLEKDGAAGLPFSKGSFSWDGQAQRRFWVDPSKKLVLVMMIVDALPYTRAKANAAVVQRDIEKAVVAAIH